MNIKPKMSCHSVSVFRTAPTTERVNQSHNERGYSPSPYSAHLHYSHTATVSAPVLLSPAAAVSCLDDANVV